MSLLKRVTSASKEREESRLASLQNHVTELTNQVDEFRVHVLENSISSPERARNFKKCSRFNSQIDSLHGQINELKKEDEPDPPKDFESKKKHQKQTLIDVKSQIQKISAQLEPDEVEEDYFRKVKRNEVEASASDLGDHNVDNDEGDDEEEDDEEETDEPDAAADENGSEEDDDESEEDTWTDQPDNTVIVKQVETLSDYPGEQPDDLPFRKGEILKIIDPREDGWWFAENSSGKRGVVPKTLIKIIDIPAVASEPIEEQHDDEASKEENDKVGELPASPKRSGKDLWKSLQKGSKQETSVTDVLKALGAMPSGFRSTTLGKMAKDERFHVSSWVVPKLRPSHLGFKDLVWDPVHKQLSPRPVKIDRVFSVMVARKIPLPGTGIEVVSRQLRMSLWDWKRKQVLSNIHVVRATQHEKDVLCWNFSAKSESSMYDGECLARMNSTEDTVGILFELSVSYLRSSTGEKSEVSCGWCLLKLFEETGVPAANKTYELLVTGGTPFEESRTELDASVSLRGTPGLFQSIVRTNLQPRLLVKLVSFNKATKDIHDTLPETLVTCHQYAQFIGQYRELVAELVFNDNREQYNTEVITDPVISTFPNVLRFPDIMDALKRRWDNRNKRELKRSQRRVSSVMKNFFREVYMDSVYALINSAQLPPFVWGDNNREMERLRIILDYDAHSTLENMFSTERLHKPFNIDRITFNVVSKHSIT